ncbi:hypothetical protein SAMN05444374_10262 [Rhodococcoides kroppenstedtii]|uniref:Uncharacterized protein n=1 Tax=Rhodococcoides kroppenstedtii TaxID=293050 RepID=A0A1I0SPC3_9NOCA|nr:hypothetical protein [Rhodococcus kroppenstedtii]MBT1192891.1 hypothetical protein [Rhodococcus kroppenstedtii]SFA41349.1 hypothetical protein SAMN05444374_10262 [Rhodococcus kroppenstedtii]
MLATVEDVSRITGYTVDDALIRRAQAVFEVCAGRPESLITLPSDLAWSAYAVAWQAAYMDNSDVFAQANVEASKQDKVTVTFGDHNFAVSRLTLAAVRNLSWNRSRSVTTRSIADERRLPVWWTF